MVFLVNKKLICIAFLALSSVDVTLAEDNAAPSEDPDSSDDTAMPILSGVTAPTAMPILSGVSTPTEAPTDMPILSGVGTPTEMPILSGVGTPTDMPILSGVGTPTDMPILSGVGTPTEAPTTAPRGGNVDENGCNPSAGYSWCPSLEECIRSFETDCPSAAPTDSPEAPGSDRDENGCIPSAGYSWCDPLKECIKSWETDCPGTTTPSPTKSPTKGPTRSPTAAPVNRPAPGSDVDENGCKSSAGYSWCASLEECIRNFETDCPAPTAKPTLGGVPAPSAKPTLGGVPAPPVVAECSAYESCRESELEGNCCPTDEGDMLGCCSGIDPETPAVAPTPPPAPPTTTEFPFTALPTAGGSSSVSSIMTVSTIAAAVAVAALL